MKKKRFDFRGAGCVAVSGLLVLGAAFNADFTGDIGAKALSFCFGKGGEAAAAVSNIKTVYYADGDIEFDSEVFSAAKPSVYSTPSDILALMRQAESGYAKYTHTGKILEETLGANAAAVYIGNASFSNKADEDLDYDAIASQKPDFGKITKDKRLFLPQIINRTFF